MAQPAEYRGMEAVNENVRTNALGGYTVRIVGALLLLTMAVVLQFSLNARRDNHIRSVRNHLLAARSCIRAFYDVKGRFPESLEELRWLWPEEDSHVPRRMYIDLTMSRQENVAEYREFNDKGGYYYDPNSGEIRLNLTRPVREYLRWYRGTYADQIPSHW